MEKAMHERRLTHETEGCECTVEEGVWEGKESRKSEGGHDGPDRRTERGHLVMEADSITILMMMMISLED